MSHDGAAPAAQLPLMLWFTPAFPTGAFAYSHGLEWAAEANLVADRAGLEDWLADLLAHGGLRNDLVLAAVAWRAANARDVELLREAAELALALQPGAERRLETVTQGNAFFAAVRDAWACWAVAWLADNCPGDVALPIAVGTLTAGHDAALADVLEAFAVSQITSLVSAAIRLSIVGQTDGQRVIAALLPRIREAASFAVAATLDDVGGAVFASDLASLRHETQYTRLFRS